VIILRGWDFYQDLGTPLLQIFKEIRHPGTILPRVVKQKVAGSKLVHNDFRSALAVVGFTHKVKLNFVNSRESPREGARLG
jgi:hypothetical protein